MDRAPSIEPDTPPIADLVQRNPGAGYFGATAPTSPAVPTLYAPIADPDHSTDPLWSRIKAFSVDDPDAKLPFSQRLARENGWSRHYACRVVEEYKRFCYLAMTAGHPVTPSDEVDQAWHLHLLYTRSYWNDFCAVVLRRPFHHGPTRGGPDESAKYHDWYKRTLSSYRRVFRAEPPADIWPVVDARFADVDSFRRVNAAYYWILPRPRWLRMTTGAASSLLRVIRMTARRLIQSADG
jgi:hypothetical protein